MRTATPVPRWRPPPGVARLRVFASRLVAPRLPLRAACVLRTPRLAQVLRRVRFVIQRHAGNTQALTQLLVGAVRGESPAWVHRVLPVVLHTRLVQRLLERRSLRTVEHAAPTHPPGGHEPHARATPVMRLAPTLPRDRSPVFPRPVMTLVRAQVPPARRADAAAVLPDAPATPRTGRAPLPATASPVVLAAPELSRITDHVIRQLDQRVLSWHERTANR